MQRYRMTQKALGFSREQLHSAGWTDELLVRHGMMTLAVRVVAEAETGMQLVEYDELFYLRVGMNDYYGPLTEPEKRAFYTLRKVKEVEEL